MTSPEAITVQIRDVDADVVDILKKRADRKGVSFSSYLRETLEKVAKRPSLEEKLEELAQREPVELKKDFDVVAAIREARDAS
ncbi:hypothetical protein QP922_11805 [Corynebacterium sp. MSK218]|uniref:FitA-like ribbon-helix-helix domain-containing protein n=1 Tax=Corynebacterium sp. MSK218 TaxID=3050218 RepID=UPI00254EAD9B|nr:hypothetical protein [Corynebacterium sp. MSK218]MDK8764496.1 hypothetical protein [Corynebacterium sp. MSK218]